MYKPIPTTFRCQYDLHTKSKFMQKYMPILTIVQIFYMDRSVVYLKKQLVAPVCSKRTQI